MTGILSFAAIRFITYQDPAVHYHANFALYINGERETFDEFMFYEEVASCSTEEFNNPKARAHMHDKVNHVIHVHDAAVTWGHFFANIGFTLGNDAVKTNKGSFISGEDTNELRFILNGKDTDIITNQPIKSEDVLLIDYGNANQKTLDERFTAIKRDAAAYNTRNDPSSCQGANSNNFSDRLRHAFGIGA